jgi:hypothetical protein
MTVYKRLAESAARLGAKAGMKAKLILVAGKADKGEVRLKLPTIIGRTREAGLMIAHKTVSRRHCELFERHGMLYVRDSGSLNGTLVDDAPIKESMLKPGHTVTVGPLTFRAEYEPADAFLGGDEPEDAVNGTAATGLTSAGESNRTAAMPTFKGEFENEQEHEELDFGGADASPNGAAEEVLDFGAAETAVESELEFGGDETLSMEIAEETTDLNSLESPEGMAALESAEFDASEFTPTDPNLASLGSSESDGPATIEDDLDVAFSLDDVDGETMEAVHVESSDDLAIDFGEETETAPQAAVSTPTAEPAAAEASDFDLDVGEELSLEPAAGESADVADLLPAGGDEDDASFDFLADDAPAAGDAAESPAAEGDEEFSLAGDDDLDFGSSEPAAAENASAEGSFDLGEDDGGTFDLADDSSPTPAAATPAAESEALDFGSEEEVTFDLEGSADTAESSAESEPAKNDAKGAAKKKPADEDDEMADFLKELGM